MSANACNMGQCGVVYGVSCMVLWNQQCMNYSTAHILFHYRKVLYLSINIFIYFSVKILCQEQIEGGK